MAKCRAGNKCVVKPIIIISSQAWCANHLLCHDGCKRARNPEGSQLERTTVPGLLPPSQAAQLRPSPATAWAGAGRGSFRGSAAQNAPGEDLAEARHRALRPHQLRQRVEGQLRSLRHRLRDLQRRAQKKVSSARRYEHAGAHAVLLRSIAMSTVFCTADSSTHAAASSPP